MSIVCEYHMHAYLSIGACFGTRASECDGDGREQTAGGRAHAKRTKHADGAHSQRDGGVCKDQLARRRNDDLSEAGARAERTRSDQHLCACGQRDCAAAGHRATGPGRRGLPPLQVRGQMRAFCAGVCSCELRRSGHDRNDGRQSGAVHVV